MASSHHYTCLPRRPEILNINILRITRWFASHRKGITTRHTLLTASSISTTHRYFHIFTIFWTSRSCLSAGDHCLARSLSILRADSSVTIFPRISRRHINPATRNNLLQSVPVASVDWTKVSYSHMALCHRRPNRRSVIYFGAFSVSLIKNGVRIRLGSQ